MGNFSFFLRPPCKALSTFADDYRAPSEIHPPASLEALQASSEALTAHSLRDPTCCPYVPYQINIKFDYDGKNGAE